MYLSWWSGLVRPCSNTWVWCGALCTALQLATAAVLIESCGHVVSGALRTVWISLDNPRLVYCNTLFSIMLCHMHYVDCLLDLVKRPYIKGAHLTTLDLHSGNCTFAKSAVQFDSSQVSCYSVYFSCKSPLSLRHRSGCGSARQSQHWFREKIFFLLILLSRGPYSTFYL